MDFGKKAIAKAAKFFHRSENSIKQSKYMSTDLEEGPREQLGHSTSDVAGALVPYGNMELVPQNNPSLDFGYGRELHNSNEDPGGQLLSIEMAPEFVAMELQGREYNASVQDNDEDGCGSFCRDFCTCCFYHCMLGLAELIE